MPRPFVIAAVFVGFSARAHAADITTITGRVVGVNDGDTITVLTDDKRQVKVPLRGTDASELGQPYGQAANPPKTAALGALASGRHMPALA